MEQKTINFRKARDFGDILSDTFVFLKTEFKPLIRVLLTYVGPFLLITGFLSAWYQSTTYENLFNFKNPDPFAAYRSMASVKYLLFMLAALASSTFLILSIFSYIHLYKTKGSNGFSTEEVWRLMIRKFFPVLGGTLLISFIFGLGLGLCAFIGSVSVALAVILVLGYLVFALYIGVSISLFVASMVFEDMGIADSISRSRFLINDYWWFTFGIAIVVLIIAYIGQVVFLAPQIVFSIVVGISSASGEPTSDLFKILLTIFTVIGTFGSYLLYAIPHTAMALHFHSQIEKKESPGLIDKINQINQPEDKQEF